MLVQGYLPFVHSTIQSLKNVGLGFRVGEIAQQVRVCTVLGALGAIPNTHDGWLSTVSNSSSRGSRGLF